MPATTDEQATPFSAQHTPTAARAIGQFGGAYIVVDCICGWEGTRHGKRHQADREWRSHRDAMRTLSPAQARYLRQLRTTGPMNVPFRTAAPLVTRGLIGTERGYPYHITPAGRGVLLEYDRTTGGHL